MAQYGGVGIICVSGHDVYSSVGYGRWDGICSGGSGGEVRWMR